MISPAANTSSPIRTDLVVKDATKASAYLLASSEATYCDGEQGILRVVFNCFLRGWILLSVEYRRRLAMLPSRNLSTGVGRCSILLVVYETR